jgi:hypothetical protein
MEFQTVCVFDEEALFFTARNRASPLPGDCSKPLAIKRRNIFL